MCGPSWWLQLCDQVSSTSTKRNALPYLTIGAKTLFVVQSTLHYLPWVGTSTVFRMVYPANFKVSWYLVSVLPCWLRENWKVRRDLPVSWNLTIIFPTANAAPREITCPPTFPEPKFMGSHLYRTLWTPSFLSALKCDVCMRDPISCCLSRCCVGCRENYRQTSTYR